MSPLIIGLATFAVAFVLIFLALAILTHLTLNLWREYRVKGILSMLAGIIFIISCGVVQIYG